MLFWAFMLANRGGECDIPTAEISLCFESPSPLGEEGIRSILPKLGPTADRCLRNLRSRIMRNQEWHTTTAKLDTLDLAELVLGLFIRNTVDSEATLGVVDQAEVLASLLNGDDVHEAGRVGDIGADLAVDLDKALHHDGLGLAVVERILEAVADEDDQRHAVAQLVRTSRRARGIGARQLVEKPVRGRAKAFLVLLPVRRSLASRDFEELQNCWRSVCGQRA